jgi:hypothetical protein
MPTVRAGVLTTAIRRGLEHIRFRGGNKGSESSPEFETSWGATAASARGGELTLGFQDLFSLVGGLIGSKAR